MVSSVEGLSNSGYLRISNLYDSLDLIDENYAAIHVDDDADDLLFISKYLNKKVEKQKKTVKDVNFPYNPMFLKKNTHLQTRFLTVSALQTSGNNQQLLYPALSLSVVETVEMTLGATAL
jgi:hypothetical protein